MHSISKSQLYEELSEQLPQYSKQAIENIGNHLFTQLTDHLAHQHPVSITNLGRFDLKYKPPVTYFDVQRQCFMQSKPHHKVKFNAALNLKTNLH